MEMKFDPMTGEPIKSETPQMRFDPMTGEPIKEQSVQMRFDPMTGKPLSGEPVVGKKKIKEKKPRRKLGKGWKALIIVASIVVICAVGVCGVCSGVFLGKSGKVVIATANTLIESAQLLQNADDWKIEEKYGKENVQLASLGSSLPMAGMPVWQGYTADSTGFLDDILQEYWTQDHIDSLNEMCDDLYDATGRRENILTLVKLFMKEYKTLNFNEAGTEIFEIDGKDCKSRGYRTTLDSDFMRQIIDDIEDLADGDMERYFGSGENTREMFDACREMVDNFPDMDVTFYIYKNKLACIKFEYEREDMQIVFRGGSTRMQNIEIIENGEIITEIRAR